MDAPELADELEQRIVAIQAIDSVLAVNWNGASSTTGPPSGPPDSDPPPRLPMVLPAVSAYQPLRLLASGGLGEVFATRDEA